MASHITDGEGKIYSAGIWTVKPGMEEAFLRRWKEFAVWTDEHQEGVVGVVMVQDAEKPNVFISFGPWADLENIRQWRQTPAFAAAFRDFKDLCEKIEPHTMKGVFSLTK